MITLSLRRAFAVILIGSLMAMLTGGARADFAVDRIRAGLSQPVDVKHAPGDNTSLFIVERNDGGGQLGRIRQYDLMTGASTTFLDVSGTVIDDGGLISMTFHPDYQSNGLFYVVSSVGASGQTYRGISRLDEYQLVGGTPQFQRRILEYTQPVHLWHTLDQVHFRPGGNNNELFVLTGDGGTQANEGSFNAALIEDPNSIYGKIMRLDLTADFSTPASDATHPGIDLVALGIRNPFRSSFDRDTGDFYFGDVGFTAREEVDFIPASHFETPAAPPLNFGWPQREGMIQTPHPPGGPLQPGDIQPILDYPHNAGAMPIGGFAVIGGYVYRGPVAELQGRYFLAEHILGNVFSGLFDTNTPPANYNGANITDIVNHTVDFENRVGPGTNIQLVTSFGEDHFGNLYMVKIGTCSGPSCPLGSGEVFRIAPTSPFEATIDRESGEIVITNATAGNVDFAALSIRSAFEAINPDELLPITGNYDVNGSGEVDDNDPWTILSTAGSHTLFHESTTGDAGALGPGEQVVMSALDGWSPSPTEDVVIAVLQGDGMVTYVPVTYTGNGDVPFDRSDLDFDGTLDPDDWFLFLANHGGSFASLSLAQAYALGDLNGDRMNDFDDFRLFQADYIDANGEAAFNALPGDIPEPATWLLALTGSILLTVARRRQLPGD
jgi:glucose/arabinose dehydrogenase